MHGFYQEGTIGRISFSFKPILRQLLGAVYKTGYR